MGGLFLLENILEGVHDDALFFLVSEHGVGFTAGGLPVHEDGAVIPLQEFLDDL